MTISSISADSHYLLDVKRLWRANSSTLGFFPMGAFDDYANRGHILAAIDGDVCIGYLIYRLARRRVIIVHLCVDDNHRGKGIATQLIEYLRSNTRQYLGIGLWCRRDYEAHKLWKHLGFIPISDKIGKSKDGDVLTFWWLDNNHPNLFSSMEKRFLQEKIAIVLDANVFYDLQDEQETSEESKALLANWLQDSTAYFVTPELFIEIDRHISASERQKKRNFASKFIITKCNSVDYDNVKKKLRVLFPNVLSESLQSDLNQLSWTLASGIYFFATRDEELLKMGDEIYRLFGMSIMRPCEIIIYIDELENEQKYQPVKLIGSNLTRQSIRSESIADLARVFQCHLQHEKKSDLRDKLSLCLADPSMFQTTVILNPEKQPIALLAFSCVKKNVLEVLLFRSIKNLYEPTLLRCLVKQIVDNAISGEVVLLRIIDKYLSPEITNVLKEDLFFLDDGVWKKFSFRIIDDACSLANKLDALDNLSPGELIYIKHLVQKMREAFRANDIESLANLEKVLWPMKISDACIPSFIVPIKPYWAAQLFEERLSNQTLFPAKPDLALNSENVYYRATTPKVLRAPGRILWYISKSKQYRGTMSIRACSRIDDIYIGGPKDLYRRFRRLGVYSWQDIFQLAGNDICKNIMAIKFCDTELLSTPIFWDSIQQIIAEEEGHRTQIQSPTQISTATFSRLYRLGT